MTAPLQAPRGPVDEIHAATVPAYDARPPRRRPTLRQAGAGALVLAAAAVVAFGLLGDGDGDGDDDGTSLRTAPPTASAPAEGGPVVTKGTDLGYLTSLSDDPSNPVLVLNRVEWLDRDDLVARAEEQGLDPAEALDFEVQDAQQDLHRYPVSPDAEVTLTVGLAPPDLQGGSVQSSLSELRTLLAQPGIGQAHLFDVTVEDGVVVRIDHRYVS